MAQMGADDAKRSISGGDVAVPGASQPSTKPRQRSRKKHPLQEEDDPSKRRCVSTACVACRYAYVPYIL